MALTKPTNATVWEDGGATCLARVIGADGDDIEQADVTSITLKVFDENAADPGATVSTASLTIASSVFDTLQTDGRWSVDSTGYNFRYTIPASTLAAGGHCYRAEFFFDPAGADEQDYPVVFSLYAEPVRSS